MPRGGDTAHMAKMKARRGAYSDVRDSRLARQIRRVFFLAESSGEAVTTHALLDFAYPRMVLLGDKLRPWHTRNVIRAARMVAIPTRRRRSRLRLCVGANRGGDREA